MSVTSGAYEVVLLIGYEFTYFEPWIHFATYVPNITGMSSAGRCLLRTEETFTHNITHDDCRMTMACYHGTPGNLN